MTNLCGLDCFYHSETLYKVCASRNLYLEELLLINSTVSHLNIDVTHKTFAFNIELGVLNLQRQFLHLCRFFFINIIT